VGAKKQEKKLKVKGGGNGGENASDSWKFFGPGGLNADRRHQKGKRSRRKEDAKMETEASRMG